MNKNHNKEKQYPKVYKISKLKSLLCYIVRFQFYLTMMMIAMELLKTKNHTWESLKWTLTVILFVNPFLALFLALVSYWRVFLLPQEVIVYSDRVVFKWKHKEKFYMYHEIKEVLSSGGVNINAYFPVILAFYLKNGKVFELSRCNWNYEELLDDLEKNGVKVTRVRRRQLTKEERKKYWINTKDRDKY
ncbi:hypothetical protein TTHT_2012 [Thermotomaculum hydrothermale]|uniref:Uncharacterized protein n=1 Tax=Thermotomaculum hydrothermale TaxID=981385 RepID=A0A7R6PGS5_9BACT|nr:hypothetical protein [Thermotomaculum hydrothermale]BBB33454.1 hypothetical protein TTHT_2012 [Thermotomaculum hydrothermale]